MLDYDTLRHRYHCLIEALQMAEGALYAIEREHSLYGCHRIAKEAERRARRALVAVGEPEHQEVTP